MVLALVVVAGASQAAAASTPITHTLRVGSTYSAEVMTLQTDLGLKADGKFGPLTKAAVEAFQTKNGLTADGVFGPKSLAALGGSTTTTTTTTTTTSSTQAGCVAGGAFSSTTGLPCTTTTTLPAGCVAGAAFSSTTGASCSTGVATAPVLNSSGEGTLTLQSAPVSLTDNVAQGDSQDAIMAFSLKATGSNIKVDRVNIDLSSASALPWNYFNNLYLYQDSTLLGSLQVNSNTLTQNTFGTNYTASFQGLNANVLVGTPSSFIVKADIVQTLPSNPVTYTVGLNDTFNTQVIRGTDGAGLSEYVTNQISNQQTVTFSSTGTGNVTVTTDASNPIGNNVVENSNQTATGITALVFDLKNTTNSVATVESISATLNNNNSYVSAYYLYNGGTSIQSLGNPNSTSLVFNNFTAFTIAPNTTDVMSIKFDAKSGASGPQSVSITGSTQVSAILNSSLASVTGSATGNTFNLIGTSGVSVNLVGSPTFATYPATVSGTTGYTTGTFVFAVSPVGVSLTDLSKAGALTVVGSTTNSCATAGDITNTISGSGGACSGVDGTFLAGTSPANNYIVSPVLNNGISDGNTANITVTINHTDTGAGNQTFTIAGLRFATTSWAGVGNAVTSSTSVGVTGGLSNATVTGYSNQ